MMNATKLKRILKELFENDDTVPCNWNPRCCELDWFSSGIKNNIVAYIYKEMFNEPISEQPQPTLSIAVPTFTRDSKGKLKTVKQTL